MVLTGGWRLHQIEYGKIAVKVSKIKAAFFEWVGCSIEVRIAAVLN